jgi:hypothetical protein
MQKPNLSNAAVSATDYTRFPAAETQATDGIGVSDAKHQ